MSDRTSLSVYLDGHPVAVTIYPYCVDEDERGFLCKAISLASILEGCTDVREIRKLCHINRGNTPEEAEIYSLEEWSYEFNAETECIADAHYVIDLTARCLYQPDFSADYGKFSIPLDVLKTRPRAVPHTLFHLDDDVLWLDDIDTNLVRQILAEQSD